MEQESIAPQSISLKAIPSRRLLGLISAMIEESGLDQETFSQTQTLLEHIENPYYAFMKVELTRQESGWILSNVQMVPYSAGARPTEPRNVS